MRARLAFFCAFLAGCAPSPLGGAAWIDAGRTDGSIASDGSVPQGIVRSDAGPDLPAADVTIVVPYGASPTVQLLSVLAAPAMLDVHLSIDTTSSFGGEIAALQTSLATEVVPAVRARVPNTSFGVSRFEDFPAPPYGDSTDRPFVLLQGVTSDVSAVSTAVGRLASPLGRGGDLPEADYEALYQIATGEGYAQEGVAIVPRYPKNGQVGGGTLGGVGFRPEALHAIVHATDATMHVPTDYLPTFPDTHGRDAVVTALAKLDARVIGIASGSPARPQLEDLAIATHATMPATGGSCPTGIGGASRDSVGTVCPLVFDIQPDGSGLSDALVSALVGLVDALRYESVTVQIDGDRLGFVRSVRAATATPPSGGTPPTTADRSPVDGIPDTFVGVHAGTTLGFELGLANDVFPSVDYDQVFRLTARVVGDGNVLLTRTIRIVVPAVAPDAGPAPDGGGVIIQ